MAQRVALVTGANTGIGKEVTRGLARRGFCVVMACRDEARGRAALEELARDTGSDRLELMRVDLSSQASVRDFARRFCATHDRLHVLVNNAGIWPTERRTSVDGIELTWATNVLGYYLLTELLLDRLVASAPARVVNVVSTYAGDLDLDDVQFERRRFDGARAYRQSKQADRLLTWAFADRLAGTGVTVNAAHPGLVRSELARELSGPKGAALRLLFRLFGKTAEEGADTPVWLAASPEVAETSGGLWASRRRLRCRFRDAEAQRRLVERCRSMLR